MTANTIRTPEQEIARLKKINRQLRAEVQANSEAGLKYLNRLTDMKIELDQMKKERTEAAARDPLYEPLYAGTRKTITIADLFWELHRLSESVRGCQSLVYDYLLAPIPWKGKDRRKEGDITRIISQTLGHAWIDIAYMVPNALPDGRALEVDSQLRDVLGRPYVSRREKGGDA